MKLIIPDKVSWYKNITENTLEHYNQNTAKRIQKTHANRNRDGISFEIKVITTDLLDWFSPLYKEKISTKNNPLVIDLYAKTIHDAKKVFSILIISENGVRIGGVIFSETTTAINIAYKIFEDRWEKSTLPAGPSLYADFLLTDYGFKTGKTVINHGKDRNGYGLTSSIGLAIFKVSLGYKPYVPKKYVMTQIETDDMECDSLYFTISDDRPELQGNLYSTIESRSKWVRLDSYTDNVSINWLNRD